MMLHRLAWTVAVYLLGVLMVVVAAMVSVASMLKLTLVKIFCAFRGEHFNVIAGMDAIFLLNTKTCYSDPSCGTMVQAVLVLKGHVDVPQFRQMIMERVIEARNPATGAKKCPRLTQKFIRRYGYWVWEETKDFSIDHHVVLHDEGYTDQASLVRLVQATTNKPFPEGRPHWGISVVPKLTEDGSRMDIFAMVLRASHTMVDGMGLLRILSLAMDKSSENTLEEILKALHLNKSCLPPLFKHNAMLRHLADPEKTLNTTKLLEIVSNVAQIILQTPWMFAFNQLYRERNGLHGPILNGRKLVAVSESMNLQIIKEVASAFGCTVSDVYYSCLVGSCWRCDPSPSNRLRVCATVLVRKPGTGDIENSFTNFSPILPMTHGDDVVARLKCVSQIVQHWKSSPEPVVNLLLATCLSVYFPAALSRQILRNYSATVAASNLYGSSFPLTIANCTIFDMFFITPNISHIGVSFSLTSYNGKIRIGVMVDRAVAPDDGIADRLVANFVQELKQLHTMAHHS